MFLKSEIIQQSVWDFFPQSYHLREAIVFSVRKKGAKSNGKKIESHESWNLNKNVNNMKAKTLDVKLKQIGVGLSDLRKRKGYDTIRDFAKAHKLPEIQYWRIENGKTNLTLKSLTRLLRIHKLTLEDFFCKLEI